MQDFTRAFPVGWFALDRDNSEVDVNIGGQLLPDVSCTFSLVLFVFVVVVVVEDAAWEIAYDALAHWFSRCWLTAGGDKWRKRAVIAIHDGGEYFDLKKGKVVSDESIWGKQEDDGLPKVPKPGEADFPRVKAPKKYAARVADAFQANDVDAIRRLIDEGWDVNQGPYREDMSLLEHISDNDNFLDMARLLLDAGAGLGSAYALAIRSRAFAEQNPDLNIPVNEKMIDLLRQHAEK